MIFNPFVTTLLEMKASLIRRTKMVFYKYGQNSHMNIYLIVAQRVNVIKNKNDSRR